MPTIYRALSKRQEEEALANRPITATDPRRTLSIQEHIDRGRGLTPYISCTRDLAIAQYYAVASNDLSKEEPNIIIEIKTERISPHNLFDLSQGKNPDNKGKFFVGSACMHCRKDREIIIKGEIPRDAYRILPLSAKDWANFQSPKRFRNERVPELLKKKYGTPYPSTSAGSSGGAHSGAGASGGASSSTFPPRK